MEVVLPRVRVIDQVILARRGGVCGKRRFGVSVQSLVATLHIALPRLAGQGRWETGQAPSRRSRFPRGRGESR